MYYSVLVHQFKISLNRLANTLPITDNSNHQHHCFFHCNVNIPPIHVNNKVISHNPSNIYHSIALTQHTTAAE